MLPSTKLDAYRICAFWDAGNNAREPQSDWRDFEQSQREKRRWRVRRRAGPSIECELKQLQITPSTGGSARRLNSAPRDTLRFIDAAGADKSLARRRRVPFDELIYYLSAMLVCFSLIRSARESRGALFDFLPATYRVSNFRPARPLSRLALLL